jgi:hypothetical protein
MTTNETTIEKPATVMGIRTAALIELALFFAVMLVLNFLFSDGTRYMHVSPHPFWFAVLLVSAQYGTNEGLVATLMATLALWLGNLPPQSIDQDMYHYVLFVAANPLLWAVSAVFLGELRNKHIRERTALQEDLASAHVREQTIAESYTRTKTLKENLEVRIAGQFRSTVEAYRAAKSIEKLDPLDVLQGMEQLVRAVMHPSQFSIFLLSGEKLELSTNSGWKDNDPYALVFDSTTPIYQHIVGRQQVLCVANSDHEATLGTQGMLAGPLVSPQTGEVVGMLKIEKINFLDLNLTAIESFTALCQWIGMSMINARTFQTARTNSVVNTEHNMLTFNYFRRHSEYVTQLARRVGFDVCMLVVKLANSDDLAADARRRAALIVSEAVDKTLRKVDLAFDYQATGQDFAIVLPATNSDGARIVLEKIKSAVNRGLVATEIPAQISYTLHSLHEQPVKVA